MSQQTQAGIQLLIDDRIEDNNSKDISAGDVREVLTAMNQSFNGPVMIYHGQLKAQGGASSTYAPIALDFYVNLAFFKQQNPLNPTLATNLVRLASASVPNATNQVDTIITLPEGLTLRIAVINNIITKLEVLKIGKGVQEGSYTFSWSGTNLTFIYNGVIIGLGTGVNAQSRFSMTESSTEGDHTISNTLIQGTPIAVAQTGALYYGMTGDNEMRAYVQNTSGADAGYSNVTIWRVA
jgi:hypothetical protein